jgi:2-succinyl-6-hydroxy-2,4-cyclohexadiene-1-carboxylate synthase
MATFTTNQTTYFYEIWGSGEPVLLLHGFTGRGANWQIVAPYLTGYQLITPDLLGHGQSAAPADPGRYEMTHAAADLVALLDHLQLDQINLIGYSMGGRLALYLALAYPGRVKKLILESASPGLATPAEQLGRQKSDEALAKRIETYGIERFVQEWEALPLWHSQQNLSAEVKAQLRQQRLQNRPEGLAHSLRGMGTGVQPNLWPCLAELACPVLLLAGELDPKFVTINQQMAQLIPQAQLQVVPAAGHTIHVERPGDWVHYSIRFVDITYPQSL